MSLSGLFVSLRVNSWFHFRFKCSRSAAAVGKDWKGKLSMVAYLIAIPLAFVAPWISASIYAGVAIAWLIPDRRIERELVKNRPQ
ncbi:MAG: hypothetical protein ACKO2G_01595 [Verrucomicrobiales bacterium]